MDKNHWQDVQWNYIKENFPNALVLESGQDFKRPTSWEKIEDVSTIRENYIPAE